jgi:hypothetical protein
MQSLGGSVGSLGTSMVLLGNGTDLGCGQASWPEHSSAQNLSDTLVV